MKIILWIFSFLFFSTSCLFSQSEVISDGSNAISAGIGINILSSEADNPVYALAISSKGKLDFVLNVTPREYDNIVVAGLGIHLKNQKQKYWASLYPAFVRIDSETLYSFSIRGNTLLQKEGGNNSLYLFIGPGIIIGNEFGNEIRSLETGFTVNFYNNIGIFSLGANYGITKQNYRSTENILLLNVSYIFYI